MHATREENVIGRLKGLHDEGLRVKQPEIEIVGIRLELYNLVTFR